MIHTQTSPRAGRTVSLWMTIPEIDAPHLSDSRPVDLLVIGAGMAGLSIAYEALLKGREVTIVDRGPIACGMTARTTAHLASALDDRYFNFIALRGESEATLLRESLMLSIDRIEQIAKDEKIDCDFARCDGYLFLGEGCNPDILEKEFEACRKIGLDVEWAEQAPMPRVDLGSCLRFPNQARFHPLKYLQGLAHGIQRLGGKFHASSAVENVAQSAAGVAVSCNGQTIMAQDVAVATNAPIAGWPTLHAKMAPYRSYAIAFAAPRGAVADALYWDTLDAYHYVRIQPGDDADHVIVGGADHKTGEEDDAPARFAALEAWSRAYFGELGSITHRWSGQVLEPVDYAGFIGRHPRHDHVYLVTGDSGQGITNGAIAGLLIPALMQNGDHAWRALYDPARVSVKATPDFVSENLTAAKSMAEHFGGVLLPSEDSLGPEEGGLVRQSLSTVAAYRDANGAMHRVSATCTHLGCVVHWNSLERCWDCPCHGSQFGVDGEVLNAPAKVPLPAVVED